MIWIFVREIPTTFSRQRPAKEKHLPMQRIACIFQIRIIYESFFILNISITLEID